MSDSVIVTCNHLSKSYVDARETIHVLSDINLSIDAGDLISIVGPSGSGKSTFLHLLGGLDQPSQGHVIAKGCDWQQLGERQRCQLRNRSFGFVYQFHHLLPEFTAVENVAMPLLIAKIKPQKAFEQAELILKDVELGQRLTHKPAALSGGERQRVAIARALVHRPECVFADEPTGNLDQATAMHVFDLMLGLNQRYNTTLVVVTHDTRIASKMHRQLTLHAGQIV